MVGELVDNLDIDLAEGQKHVFAHPGNQAQGGAPDLRPLLCPEDVEYVLQLLPRDVPLHESQPLEVTQIPPGELAFILLRHSLQPDLEVLIVTQHRNVDFGGEVLFQDEQALQADLEEIQLGFGWGLLHGQPVVTRVHGFAVFQDCELVVVVQRAQGQHRLRLN